ncbi:hypothetical protein ZOSMA_2G01170 [Zostera marina]|uniref:Uncharacterized protein n=1 Tax=Zostera marina TaxID=29655 RepID=A0A0K9PAX3_ZOSMR|nr:hypothetical protein ZOSMA_2G01170 [Zostera marina]
MPIASAAPLLAAALGSFRRSRYLLK